MIEEETKPVVGVDLADSLACQLLVEEVMELQPPSPINEEERVNYGKDEEDFIDNIPKEVEVEVDPFATIAQEEDDI